MYSGVQNYNKSEKVYSNSAQPFVLCTYGTTVTITSEGEVLQLYQLKQIYRTLVLKS